MKFPISAKRLQDEVDRVGIKPVELSEKTGISQASISQYLNGSHAPSNGTADVLGEYFGCNPLWLMGFEGTTRDVAAPPEKAAQEIYNLISDAELVDILVAYKNLPAEKQKRAKEVFRLVCSE